MAALKESRMRQTHDFLFLEGGIQSEPDCCSSFYIHKHKTTYIHTITKTGRHVVTQGSLGDSRPPGEA